MTQPEELSKSGTIALLQAEVGWNNVRAAGSTMTFEAYLKLIGLSVPPAYVELVKSRDPFARPRVLG